MADSLNNSRSASGHLFNNNPVIRKLAKVQETDAQNCCTYAGIRAKLVYFMVMVVLGAVASLFVRTRSIHWSGSVLYSAEGITMTSTEVLFIGAIAIVFILSLILSLLIKATIPVTGALYCLSTGYLVSWAAYTFGKEYASLILLALLITAVVVTILGYLYFSGKVQVTKKLRTVLIALVFTVLGISLLSLIMYLIPFTRSFVSSLMDNAVLSIAGSVVMVVIACLFLLVDFDTIRGAVEDELPKKYEWWAAYGLAFSVIWLFFKILELLGKLKGNNKN